MVEPATLARLIEFGMTEREAKLYLAMLERPETSPPELHRISGVPRTKIYETLERMVSSGFCLERVEGRRRFFRAVSPDVLKETFLRRWDLERERKRQGTIEFFDNLDEMFETTRKQDRSLDFIQVIRSTEQINQKYLTLIRDTEDELLSFNRSPYACLDPEVLREQERVLYEALDRGVKVKCIYMMEGQKFEWVQQVLLDSEKVGEEARVIDFLPMKMFVFDRKKVMLALPSIPGQKTTDFTMVVVEDPGFALSCLMLFETQWVKSNTYEEWMAIEGQVEMIDLDNGNSSQDYEETTL